MLGLKLNHVSKRGHWSIVLTRFLWMPGSLDMALRHRLIHRSLLFHIRARTERET